MTKVKGMDITTFLAITVIVVIAVYGLTVINYENNINSLEFRIDSMNYTIQSQKDVIIHYMNKSNECQEDLYQEEWNNTICQYDLQNMKNNEPTFVKVSRTIANEHEYDADNYNCQDFSRDLSYALQSYGYETNRIFGKYLDCDPHEDQFQCFHQWTKLTVYIESTTGKVLEPDEYKEFYKPIRVVV